MFYVYIIYSKTADKYYTGNSENPWERILQRNESDTDKYTGKYSNWELVAVFKVSENKGDAMVLEKFIKKQKTRKLIEKLINPNYIPTDSLAQLVIPYLRDARAGLIRGSSRRCGILKGEQEGVQKGLLFLYKINTTYVLRLYYLFKNSR